MHPSVEEYLEKCQAEKRKELEMESQKAQEKEYLEKQQTLIQAGLYTLGDVEISKEKYKSALYPDTDNLYIKKDANGKNIITQIRERFRWMCQTKNMKRYWQRCQKISNKILNKLSPQKNKAGQLDFYVSLPAFCGLEG